MRNRSHDSLDLPYGRWAAWGVALSAAVTLAAVLFAPLSPVRLAREAAESLRAPQARAATAAARSGPAAARELAGMERWLAAELSRELRLERAPEVRTRLRLEMRRELRRALREGLDQGLRGSLGDLLGVRAASHVPVIAPLPSITLTL